MNAKHTPGPWKENLDGEIFSENGYRICNPFLSCGTVPSIDTQEANAALIAAAPELLEALRALYMAVRDNCSTDVAMKKARKAILKAAGE